MTSTRSCLKDANAWSTMNTKRSIHMISRTRCTAVERSSGSRSVRCSAILQKTREEKHQDLINRLQKSLPESEEPLETNDIPSSDFSESEDPPNNGPTAPKDMSGYGDLLACAVLLGTYNPTLKMIFAEDHPMDPATLTAVRTFIAAIMMGGIIAAKPRAPKPDSSTVIAAQKSGADSSRVGTLTYGPLDAEGEMGGSSSKKSDSPLEAGLKMMALGGVVAAGVELGLYLFVEVSTESVGLQLTSATRAGFLTQSTAVLTPVLSYLVGERISPQMWAAVGTGLLGSCLVAYGGIASESADMAATYPDELKGVLLLLAASLAISLATIRMGTLAFRFDPVDLAAVRQITLGVASLAWFAGQHHAGVSPGMSLWQQAEALGLTERSIGSWALILYSSLGPGALATYLQTKGQGKVQATPSQIIHSTTPIWSALAAIALGLGGESMGPWSWAGGAAVLAATVLASQA